MPNEIDLSATQAALVTATHRTACLLRETPDGQKPALPLTWTVAETAAHLVTILQHSARFVSGEEDATEYATLDPNASTTAERSVTANARMLEEFTERDPVRLAALLETAADEFVAVADQRRRDEPVLIEAGISMTVPSMTAVLLGEELVHGLDIARALSRPWKIDRDDALPMLRGGLHRRQRIFAIQRVSCRKIIRHTGKSVA